ncbi:hypothetical protein M2175_006671 [Bradyrhizobium elkanii]|uniref:hypothetical protein n=1 Tax=Bradyrhizobium TaxID=374 RepID=UPI00216A2F73|nr:MULTISPECIES: hypothetical protein [Bradyrhizobium]MCS3931640.1 hypothetical protein [Bradyrhizobium elkanii]MCS3972198.1 hypothetical protein [Bradyrhizobium japonicum]
MALIVPDRTRAITVMNINHVTFASREPMRQTGPRGRRAWGDQCARALSSVAITSTGGTMLDQSRARFKKMHPARAGCKVLSIVDQAET